MIESDLLAYITGFFIFYRWHPEVALRYLPIVDSIKKLPGNPSILDVGSGGLGIAPYIRRPVTGLDIEFYPPYHPNLKQVKGSAIGIPFPDNSYDVVVSTDTLEHISTGNRSKAVEEMMRVAKKMFFIGVPAGKKAQEQDERLDYEYERIHHKHYHFLQEQIGLGLPSLEEILKEIKNASLVTHKKVEINIIGNESLKIREVLMQGWMSKNPLKAIFYRKVMLFLIPFLRRRNEEPVYRKIFQVSILP
ncbi:hypothetical protein A3D77_02390 [Candidatus Gottesmanbacteria bacterium RIFCSPHIGHO2_02_FULL_39_11]|uniref:Methyltransferase type 11 domain-containing protein n=1 Tax=Candidatus Gottesmanbacteria bacterium RIFCSPHIGHO2_02_FULL_39_11 TaxID=1798382 RepID=A0A1F5ZVB0_9BACT|nr:MAG: hypothetical protein A3D77_02390 [Candidatus Gottesmanbacteria bacterium RIFCSPHIGHO2_02_FULL_39_11]